MKPRTHLAVMSVASTIAGGAALAAAAVAQSYPALFAWLGGGTVVAAGCTVVAAASGGQALINLIDERVGARGVASASLVIVGLIAVGALQTVVASGTRPWQLLSLWAMAIGAVVIGMIAPAGVVRFLITAKGEPTLPRLSIAGWCSVLIVAVSMLGLGIPLMMWLFQGQRPWGLPHAVLAILPLLIGLITFGVCGLLSSVLGVPLRRGGS